MVAVDKQMVVLIVEDDEWQSEALQLLIARLGHRVEPAYSGAEAIRKFTVVQPDIVLLDYELPDMRGPEVLQHLRSLSGDLWRPVLFISAHDEVERQVECIQRGGDDFIAKPINFRMLEVRMNAMRRLAEMHGRLREQALQLRALLDRNDHENAAASYLYERLVAIGHVEIAGISRWQRAAENFSGDLLASAVGPNGHIYLLLADATGHGLSAALGLIPVTQTFNAMSLKGHPIAAIAREMNRQIRQYTPTHRYVAAVLIEVQPNELVFDIWNGGVPAPLVLSKGAHISAQCVSRHLPLGLLRDEEFRGDIERFPFAAGDTLVCTSDGTQEAQNGAGEFYGADCWERMLAEGPRPLTTEFIRSEIERHLAGQAPQDDIAVLAIDFDALPRVDADGAQSCAVFLAPCAFELQLSPIQLANFDPVPAATEWLQRMGLGQNLVARAHTILMELVTNAVDHGLLRLSSGLKASPDGFAHYLRERQERMKTAEGLMSLHLSLQPSAAHTVLRLRVEDSGDGFDTARLNTSASAAVDANDASGAGAFAQFGRGLTLVRMLCQKLEYQQGGRIAEAELRF